MLSHLILRWNDEKCQTLNTLQLNVVHLNTRNISNSNSLYIIHDSFKKKWWQDMLNFTTRDRLIGYFRMARICYSKRFEDVYKTLINIAEAYFLPLNKASNIITLKVKVLSPNSWHQHVAIAYVHNFHKSEASYPCSYQKKS